MPLRIYVAAPQSLSAISSPVESKNGFSGHSLPHLHYLTHLGEFLLLSMPMLTIMTYEILYIVHFMM